MGEGPATSGRDRAFQRMGRRHRSVQSIRPETVLLYRAITRRGRPYGWIGYSWDLVVAGCQQLLLYDDGKHGAKGQPRLQRALNEVALERPEDLRSAIQDVILAWANGGPVTRTTRRRLRHAVETLNEWDGYGRTVRRQPAGARRPGERRWWRLGRERQPARALSNHGPRGLTFLGRQQARDERGRWKREEGEHAWE